MVNRNILLFETEGIIALHLRLLIEQNNYDIIDNVYSVSDFVKRLEKKDFDLVVCDPVLNSNFSYDDLLNYSSLNNIPFIFISENKEKYLHDDYYSPASVRIIKKPFDETELLESIRDLLSVNA